MTNTQMCALNKIDRLIRKSFYGEDYEIKQWDVKQYDHFVSVVAEWGMVGDEGTMAAIFCRDRVHLFVGKCGGITYPVYNKKGHQITKRLGCHSILTAVLDQKGR